MKINKHIITIGFNGIRTFMPAITLFLISFLLINRFSLELWGNFVAYLLVVNLTAHIINWGNKEYLIRAFSEYPSKISSAFYTHLFSRGLILILSCPILFLCFELEMAFWLIFWVTGLYLYQSSESLIIYTKKFNIQVLVEAIALVISLAYIMLNETISVLNIIQLFTLVMWIKVLFVLITIYPSKVAFGIDLDQLKLSAPFFIIGLSGLLQSRVDQYIIALNCSKEMIASYQLFLSMFILLQSLSSIIFVPFNKIIYRIGIDVFRKIQLKIAILSVLLVVIITPALSLILSSLFHLEINVYFYIIGAFFAFPPFIYVPIIYLFYRVKREKEIMYVNYIGAGSNLLLTFYFVNYGNPFNAVVASALAQWGMLIWYSYRKKGIIHEIKLSSL